MYSGVMRILINLLNFRPGRIGGTETYLRELIAHLPQVAKGERIILLTGRDVAQEFRASSLEVATVPCSNSQISGLRFLEAATSWFHARSIEADIRRLNPDVVLYPQQSMFPKATSCASVVIIHDLYHLNFPKYCSRIQRWFRNRSYPAAVARADRVIAVSEVTRRSVIENYGCAPERITVVRHGIRELSPESVPPADLAYGRYLCYPAVTLPHKNHELLFRSIAGLRDQGRFPYRLILTGAKTRHWRALEKLRCRLSLEDTVFHLGYLPYGTILSLIRGAECVVFPSQCEGFGIPVIEAAMLDRKVITSKLDVFEEIGVPQPYRIDFGDLDAFDRALRDTSSSRLERRPSTWLECARATLDVLCQTAETARTGAGPHFELAANSGQRVTRLDYTSHGRV
jgi:glycosyltransferase involved in cell wall biosynthesis